MLNKLINFVQHSNVAKFFLVGLIVALIHTLTKHFSYLLLMAVVSSTIPILLKLKIIEDKLNYDQKANSQLNSLTLTTLLWAIFMWKDLQLYPEAYAFTFVTLVMATLLLFTSLKQRLFIIAPLLIVFISLLLFILVPSAKVASVVAVIFITLFLLNDFYKKEAPSSNHQPGDKATASKLEYVAEIDGHLQEIKQLQEKLKQNDIDLSAAEMAKMEFLAMISHEIRTPLNGIIPLLDILLDSELSDFQRDYLSTAHISAIQMQKLIDDLLDYSKVEAGKLTVETRGLKVPQIMKAVKSSFIQAARKKNLKIKVDVHMNVSPLLRGDPTRLRQVLSNLISNAIKFSTIGTITITAKKLKDFPNKEIIRFEVIDQGIGLDQETSDNIFLPFTQEDGSSTRKFGGTGLGLAISKKIVDLMQGTIYVESKKGKGSNFYFDLPLLKSVGETQSGVTEASGFHAILVNTNPLLFNKIAQKLQAEDVPFQKALGMSQAYEIYSSIVKMSTNQKNVLIFVDFETAGKQVRSLCHDLVHDKTMTNLFACILSENNKIAGIPQNSSIKLLSKDESIGRLLNNIEISFLSKEPEAKVEEEESLASEGSIVERQESRPVQTVDRSTLLPEVLLVEDNEVNLKVAEKLIQYIGYPFDFAMNGQEAFEKVKLNRYRMILMDCQMPVMDGYRCTAKIRDYEMAAGLNRTPILAMTANAMLGDREKCLDAGMDDYMSKPLNRYILEKTLKKWDPLVQTPQVEEEKTTTTKQTSETKDAADSHAEKSTVVSKETISINNENIVEDKQEKTKKKIQDPDTPINQKWLSTKALENLKEFMGDEIVQLLEMFEQETPSILKKMSSALKNNNLDEIKKMAHMLKSTSANIGANGLSFFSRKMELAAEHSESKQLNIIINKIKKAYMLTSAEIAKYINSQ